MIDGLSLDFNEKENTSSNNAINLISIWSWLDSSHLYAVMMKFLGLFKLAGGVVFVCWQKLALVHVVDLFSGQVEREAKIFEHAVISAVEIIDRLDGNDRCHVQGTVAMLHKAAFNGIAARVIGNLPLDREETGYSLKESNGE